jgi:hypothetical protein
MEQHGKHAAGDIFTVIGPREVTENLDRLGDINFRMKTDFEARNSAK